MDKETQQRRILNLVKTITTRALALPAKNREAFIDIEIMSFRQTSADTYQTNPDAKAAALDLADKMHEWISAMIKMLEASDKAGGRSDLTLAMQEDERSPIQFHLVLHRRDPEQRVAPEPTVGGGQS